MRFNFRCRSLGLFILTVVNTDLLFAEVMVDPLIGLSGKVNVGEVSNTSAFEVGYLIDVAPDVSLGAFAVSFANTGESSGFALNPFQNNWDSRLLSESRWNSGWGFNIGSNSLNTMDFGTFDSVFGTEDDYAALYFHSGDSSPNLIDNSNDHPMTNWLSRAGETDGQDPENYLISGFQADVAVPFIVTGAADPRSNFLALTPSGAVADGSFYSASVPEPSCYVLLGIASLGLVGYRRLSGLASCVRIGDDHPTPCSS